MLKSLSLHTKILESRCRLPLPPARRSFRKWKGDQLLKCAVTRNFVEISRRANNNATKLGAIICARWKKVQAQRSTDGTSAQKHRENRYKREPRRVLLPPHVLSSIKSGILSVGRTAKNFVQPLFQLLEAVGSSLGVQFLLMVRQGMTQMPKNTAF